MTIYTIYKITNKVNGKGYIGFDSNWPNRKTEHISNYTNTRIKKILYSAMRKYGIDNFNFEILYQSDNLDYTLNIVENSMILEHNTFIKNGYGYNQTLGGEGTLGRNTTIKTKKKMSKSALRRKNRTSRSEEDKNKLRLNNIIHKSRTYEITSPSGEILIIHGMREYCRENNLNQGNMIQVALGKKAHHKHYTCRKL